MLIHTWRQNVWRHSLATPEYRFLCKSWQITSNNSHLYTALPKEGQVRHVTFRTSTFLNVFVYGFPHEHLTSFWVLWCTRSWFWRYSAKTDGLFVFELGICKLCISADFDIFVCFRCGKVKKKRQRIWMQPTMAMMPTRKKALSSHTHTLAHEPMIYS